MSEQQSSCAAQEQKSGTVEYRDVFGFPGYRVGSDGTVWSSWGRHGRSVIANSVWRLLKATKTHKGYLAVVLIDGKSKKNKHVHRLVLEAFCGPCPEGMQGCHNNGVAWDCRLENLRWDTVKENSADRERHGTAIRGEMSPRAKLTVVQVEQARRMYLSGAPMSVLAKKYSVTRGAIWNAIRGNNWKWITEQEAVDAEIENLLAIRESVRQ